VKRNLKYLRFARQQGSAARLCQAKLNRGRTIWELQHDTT
jgi:hypothetical protein